MSFDAVRVHPCSLSITLFFALDADEISLYWSVASPARGENRMRSHSRTSDAIATAKNIADS